MPHPNAPREHPSADVGAPARDTVLCLGGIGLDALAERVRAEMALLSYPEIEWVPPSAATGTPNVDVLIVGAGQGGIAIAAQLQRERVGNVWVVDRAARGAEGPWRSYARMRTLRSWKTVTGPDLGLPAATFQAWFEAQHGAAAFDALGKIAKEDWADYLLWLRDVLRIPVRNDCMVTRIEPRDGRLQVSLACGAGTESVSARKVVLAMGIERSGHWWMPAHIAALPQRFRAHTADPIDFAALAGKRVAVLGGGASAFDNAATALEAGAAAVELHVRREQLQRVQPYKAISYAGFLRHFRELDDATRWRFMHHLLSIREALPAETWARCTRDARFELHTGSPWESVEVVGDAVQISTPNGVRQADFLILGTGFAMDLSRRTELAAFTHLIATWADRYQPPAELADLRMGAYPYLGSGFEFVEREPGTAPFLRDIHLFDFGATMSFGPSGSSINAMKYAVPRLVNALTRDLFVADIDTHYRALRDYRTPEFDLVFERDRRDAAVE